MHSVLGIESKMAAARKGVAKKKRTAGSTSFSFQYASGG